MKKTLLLAAIAALTVSASAEQKLTREQIHSLRTQRLEKAMQVNQFKTFEQDGRQVTFDQLTQATKDKMLAAADETGPVALVEIPETAEEQIYQLNGYFYSIFGLSYYEGLSQMGYADGDDVYFGNLFPTMFADAVPVKGTKSETGLTVKEQAIFGPYDYYGDGSEIDTLIVTLMLVDEEGNIELPEEETDIEFYAAEDGGYYLADPNDPAAVVYIGIKDQFGGLWTIGANYELIPFTPTSEAAVLPEGAETLDYIYDLRNSVDSSYTRALAPVYFDGNDAYILTPYYMSWIKGTVDGDKMSFPTGQFLGTGNVYLSYMKALKDYYYSYEIDWDTYEVIEDERYEPLEALTFTKIDDKWVIDEGQSLAEVLIDDYVISAYGEIALSPYAGDVPAVPAAATNVELYDYTEYYGQWAFYATIPAEDVDGNYIRPENQAIALYQDGDIMTFTAEDGYYVSEDIEWMPYGWYDEEGGYDIGFYSSSVSLYLYLALFEEIGIQVSYTVDGVTNYSKIVYVNADGETREEDPSAIFSIKADKSSNVIYNLMGQKVEKAQRGVNVMNGKKMFVK